MGIEAFNLLLKMAQVKLNSSGYIKYAAIPIERKSMEC